MTKQLGLGAGRQYFILFTSSKVVWAGADAEPWERECSALTCPCGLLSLLSHSAHRHQEAVGVPSVKMACKLASQPVPFRQVLKALLPG